MKLVAMVSTRVPKLNIAGGFGLGRALWLPHLQLDRHSTDYCVSRESASSSLVVTFGPSGLGACRPLFLRPNTWQLGKAGAGRTVMIISS